MIKERDDKVDEVLAKATELSVQLQETVKELVAVLERRPSTEQKEKKK